MTINPEWREFEDTCPECGEHPVMVQTGASGNVYADQQAMCPDCGLLGCVDVDEDGEGWIDWNEPPKRCFFCGVAGDDVCQQCMTDMVSNNVPSIGGSDE